jgi:copper chaperone
MLRIGQIAARTELGHKTLRFYEDKGLVKPKARTAGGFRLDERNIGRLHFIPNAKALGFTLDEIRKPNSVRNHSAARNGTKGAVIMASTKLVIGGMTCTHCAHTVERALTSVEGVERARVNYLRKEAEVQGKADERALVEAVEGAGYRATPEVTDRA